MVGTVQRTRHRHPVEVRLFNVPHAAVAFAREYTGRARNPRALRAHDRGRDPPAAARRCAASRARSWRSPPIATASGWRARSKNASVKEIYIADYDGANQRRVTMNRLAEHHARLVARRARHRLHVVSRGATRHPHLEHLPGHDGDSGEGREPQLAAGRSRRTARSICFTSNRDGNSEIYVMNRDGSGVRRLTNHRRSIRRRPGRRPARRSRSRRIARARRRSTSSVSTASALRQLTYESVLRPGDLVAGAVQRDRVRGAHRAAGTTSGSSTSRPAPIRQITFGEGTNESPATRPTAATWRSRRPGAARPRSSRSIATARGLRQITRTGNNFTPNWSQ